MDRFLFVDPDCDTMKESDRIEREKLFKKSDDVTKENLENMFKKIGESNEKESVEDDNFNNDKPYSDANWITICDEHKSDYDRSDKIDVRIGFGIFNIFDLVLYRSVFTIPDQNLLSNSFMTSSMGNFMKDLLDKSCCSYDKNHYSPAFKDLETILSVCSDHNAKIVVGDECVEFDYKTKESVEELIQKNSNL